MEKKTANFVNEQFWLFFRIFSFDMNANWLVGWPVQNNQNEINEQAHEDEPSKQASKIWTVLIDKINYSTRKTTASPQ